MYSVQYTRYIDAQCVRELAPSNKESKAAGNLRSSLQITCKDYSHSV